jgi:hypothetical protein
MRANSLTPDQRVVLGRLVDLSQASRPGQVLAGPQPAEDPLGFCQGFVRLGLTIGQHGWRNLAVEDSQMIEGLAQLVGGSSSLGDGPALQKKVFGFCPLSPDDSSLAKESAAKGLCKGSVSADGEGDGSAAMSNSAIKLAQFQVGLGQAGVSFRQ